MIAEQPEATKGTRKRVGKPKSKKAPASKKPTKVADKTREGSKTATVLALLRRKGGVTSAELIEATGWQPHTVRAFLAAVVRKKLGLRLASEKTDGERVYRIVAGKASADATSVPSA